MAKVRTIQVVPRDRSILAALAVARYLGTRQIGRLAFSDRDESIVRRRLTRLALRAAPDLDPLVRFIRYRDWSGKPERAWALTEAGYTVAQNLVPYARSPGSDVGAAFLEHTLILNDVLIDLIARAAGNSEAWYSEIPFRWMPEGATDLLFDYWDGQAQKIEKGRIRPDATLEIGEPRRRLFLECETGSRSIVSADPTNTGATWAKIQRYGHLLAGKVGQHDTRTPYAILFPGGLTPVLLFLVASHGRREGIRKLVAERKAAVRIAVRAYTLGEAATVLGALVTGRRAPPPSPAAVEVTNRHLEVLGAALSQCDGALDEARRTVERHNRSLKQPVRSVGPLRVPEAPEALRQALVLLARLRPGDDATPPSRKAGEVTKLTDRPSVRGTPTGR